MSKKTKKPQVRTCSICNKIGHNKSRCPEFFNSVKIDDKKNKPSVAIYIHEKFPTIHSEHIINLKQKESLWKQVEAVVPDNNSDLYDFNHDKPIANIIYKPLVKKIKAKVINIKKEDEKNKIINKQCQIQTMPLIKDTIVKKEKSKIQYKNIILSLLIKLKPIKKKKVVKKIQLKIEKVNQPQKYIPKYNWAVFSKMTIRATIVILLLITPFKASSYYQSIKETTNQVSEKSIRGFMSIQESTSAIMQSDILGAETSIVEALENFDNAIKIMDGNHQLLQKIASTIPIVADEVQSRQQLITAGQKISLGNTYLIKGIRDSQESDNTTTTLTKKIQIITNHLKAAIPNYQAAIEDLSLVNPDILPLEYQSAFKDFNKLFITFLDDLKNLSELGSAIEEIFGGNGLRRYLIIFQNPDEIRATGGFLGSFAMIDIKDGQIDNIDIPAGGSYDLKGQLDQFVEPPTPLLLSNKRWEFQDSNWFPDFPTSAEKILWFYRHSRNITADGVIAINSTVLERLLSIFGPIEDKKRSITLSADNAIETIQKIVEHGPEKKIQKPKQIISDLAPQFIQYLYGASNDKIIPLLINLLEVLEQKEIQSYFADENVESTINSFGWGGKIIQTTANQDYLMVINTNVQGQKSDSKIKQSIEHQSIIDEDGNITNTVVIEREHTGIPNESLYGQTNINYIRVYVPENSELISAGGFIWPDENSFKAPYSWTKKDKLLSKIETNISFDEKTGTRISSEFNKTVFGNWIIIEPGETQKIYFTYRLPFNVKVLDENNNINIFKKIINEDYSTSQYQLILQKQSGQNTKFNSQIIYPKEWHPIWSDGTNTALANNGLSINEFSLKNDEVWGLIMKK